MENARKGTLPPEPPEHALQMEALCERLHRIWASSRLPTQPLSDELFQGFSDGASAINCCPANRQQPAGLTWRAARSTPRPPCSSGTDCTGACFLGRPRRQHLCGAFLCGRGPPRVCSTLSFQFAEIQVFSTI